jgi:hypothetical protein
MDLHYYHAISVKESEGKLYNDDGETPAAYEKGEYEMLRFNSAYNSGKLSIELASEKGDHYKAIDKKISHIIHNIENQPKKVSINGKKVDFTWDEKSNTLRFVGELKKEKNQTITIKLAK